MSRSIRPRVASKRRWPAGPTRRCPGSTANAARLPMQRQRADGAARETPDAIAARPSARTGHGVRPRPLSRPSCSRPTDGLLNAQAGYRPAPCATATQADFGDLQPPADMTDSGTRAEPPHAINGPALPGTRYGGFGCTWGTSGAETAGSIARLARQTVCAPCHHARGRVSRGQGGKLLAVTGVRANGMRNVPSRPATQQGIAGPSRKRHARTQRDRPPCRVGTSRLANP